MPDFSSVQIPKPLDWQAFQRGCVPLFRFLLRDDELVEFGRSGQDQKGIDLLGYRNGNTGHPVGVQCRHVEELKLKAIKATVEDARAIVPPLRELIFATTAKHDANLQQEAAKLTKELKASGWDCRISVRGWESLQADIAHCPEALNLFWPILADVGQLRTGNAEILAAIEAQGERVIQAVGIVRESAISLPLDPKLPPEALSERQDIHAVISTYRDMLLQGKTETAITGLGALRSTTDLPPFARYRLETNIAAAHLRAGRPEEALKHWREALVLRPNDSKARTNVALGLLANGDAANARRIAREVLVEQPDLAAAQSVLIQASVDDESVADPRTLIPAEALLEPDVAASIASFLRKRDDPSWPEAVEAALKLAPTDWRFRQWRAEAILEPVLASTAVLMGSPAEPGTSDAVKEGVELLRPIWEAASEEERPEPGPYAALSQNFAAALRFSGESEEAARVLDKALMRLGRDENLVRVRALLHLHADEDALAIKLIGENPVDPELGMLRAEMLSRSNPIAAASAIDAIDLTSLPRHLAKMAVRVRLELAIELDEFERLEGDLERLEALGESAAGLALMRAQIAKRHGGGEDPDDKCGDVAEDVERTRSEIQQLAERLHQDRDVDFLTRAEGAQFLMFEGANEAASDALDGHVDFSRDTPALRTYVAATIQAGLLVRARDAIARLAPDVAQLSFFRKAVATFLWNTGDAARAEPLIQQLYVDSPRSLERLLWWVDCLVRTGREQRVRDLLSSVNDDELDGELEAKARLVRALCAFGQAGRGRKLAYRLFMVNRDSPEAWMALMSSMLGAPSGDRKLLDETVTTEAVIEIETPHKEKQRYLIESDDVVRKVAADAVGPSNEIAKRSQGLKSGDEFAWPAGGNAKIVTVKNKYLDAFHKAIARYNEHFPDAEGFSKVHFDPEAPDGLDEMKAILAQRSEHVRTVAAEYAAGRLTLGMLGALTGSDPVEAMIGLQEVETAFRVSAGLGSEREAAFAKIIANEQRGCVVDAATLHVLRRLELEASIEAVLGRISIVQVTLDRLRDRFRLISDGSRSPAGSLAYVDGKIRMTEIPPEAIVNAREVLQSDIDWIERGEVDIEAAVPAQELPPPLRRINSIIDVRVFDEVFAASGSGKILLAEDLGLRQFADEMDVASTWLQPVLMLARNRGEISAREYARAVCELADFGEEFISVDGATLFNAFQMDVQTPEVAPGRRFCALVRCLGGPKADVDSHVGVAAGFLLALWSEEVTDRDRFGATSKLLYQLVRGRSNDWHAVLRLLKLRVRELRALIDYIDGWTGGHFLGRVRP